MSDDKPAPPIPKDKDAKLDYGWNWQNEGWLVDGDTIVTSTWVITPDGLTKLSEDNTETVARVWVSGGTPGTTYKLTNHVTTAAGREDDRTLRIRVTER